MTDTKTTGIDRDHAEKLLGQLDEETLLVYPLGPAPVWAYQEDGYLMLVRDDDDSYRESSTSHERVVEHLEQAFWTEHFGTEPSLVDIDDAPTAVRRAAR